MNQEGRVHLSVAATEVRLVTYGTLSLSSLPPFFFELSFSKSRFATLHAICEQRKAKSSL